MRSLGSACLFCHHHTSTNTSKGPNVRRAITWTRLQAVTPHRARPRQRCCQPRNHRHRRQHRRFPKYITHRVDLYAPSRLPFNGPVSPCDRITTATSLASPYACSPSPVAPRQTSFRVPVIVVAVPSAGLAQTPPKRQSSTSTQLLVSVTRSCREQALKQTRLESVERFVCPGRVAFDIAG